MVHGEHCPVQAAEGGSLFGIQCQECGGVCCYADDSTFTVAGSDPEELSTKLTQKYAVLADFLTDNMLKVNDDKTHLLVMSTRQKRQHRSTSTISIITPTATITPSAVERLLGAQVHEDMHWREHIMDNKESLVKSLNKRIGALKNISPVASFMTRKNLANGIFMSKLIYLMPVWMGCEDFLVNSLQVCLNKAARLVTKLDRFTPTDVLMTQCGWLQVHQLMAFHSLVLLHKTHKQQKPTFLYQKITSGSGPPNTRQVAAAAAAVAAAGLPRQPTVEECELSVTRKSWSWAAVGMYSRLPIEILSERNEGKFKTMLKNWVKLNI